jgi:hypothetical protein
MAKSTKPMVRIHNTETNEVVDREMDDVEFAQYEKDKANAQKEKAEAEAKESARQALLTRLGITAEEAQLLLGGN